MKKLDRVKWNSQGRKSLANGKWYEDLISPDAKSKVTIRTKTNSEIPQYTHNATIDVFRINTNGGYTQFGEVKFGTK